MSKRPSHNPEDELTPAELRLEKEQREAARLAGKRWVAALVGRGQAQYKAFGEKTPLQFPSDVVALNWMGIDPPDIHSDPSTLSYLFNVTVALPISKRRRKTQAIPEGIPVEAATPMLAKMLPTHLPRTRSFDVAFSAYDLAAIFRFYHRQSPHVQSIESALSGLDALRRPEIERREAEEMAKLKAKLASALVVKRVRGKKGSDPDPT